MADIKRDVKYVDRTFNDFRNALIQYTKTYFPNTYNDFTDSATGMLFMEQASYIADNLAFYLDNQVQENFVPTARQIQNLYKLSYTMGYVPKVTTPAQVEINFYQQLPATLSASVNVPDYSYALIIPENTQISTATNDDVAFLIQDRVDFTYSSSQDPTNVSVYQVSGDQPTYFLLKKTRKAISAKINTTTFTFTDPVKFDTRDIDDTNIIGILDVTDSDGNIWYEVPNLAQENVFDTIRNSEPNDPNQSNDTEVPYLLRLKKVQRRFVSRFLNKTTLQLQFGAGAYNDNDEEVIPNPDNVGLGLPYEKTKLTTAFSPVNFIMTNTYGIAPRNTTLTVRYLTGGGVESNVEQGTLTGIDTTNIVFSNSNQSSDSVAQTVFDSIASSNPKAADGGSDGDDVYELRQNIYGTYQSQLRNVTKDDYVVRALSMPSNLGTISKAYAEPSKVSETLMGQKATILDLYVLSYDINKNLRTASQALKNNLRTYLYEYRMINDTVRIRDGHIINIGVDFDITVRPNQSNEKVLLNCINSLKEYFNIDRWQINQPILLKELELLIDKVEGVQTVKKVTVTNKTGSSSGYSNFAYDIETATIDRVVYPSLDPMIFEVKYPDTDIKGRVVPL